MSDRDRLWERRLPLVVSRTVTRYVDPREIYYVEADVDDTMIRTRRRARYHSVEALGELEKRLLSPPFFRCHQSFIVNLERVRELRSRGERDHELKLDPPVNAVLPLARNRLRAIRRAMEGR